MRTRSLKIIGAVTATILLIPLIAMQFTSEVNWNGFDFLIAAILIFGVGLLIDLIARKTKGMKYRPLYFAGAILLFILVWMELAVGIFGTPLAGN